jgi:hypothetical protein
VKSPKAALAGLIRRPRDFDKAVVEGQTVSNAVLPALLILSVKGEGIHNILINLTEGAHAMRRGLDGHGDEGNVGIWRFGLGVIPAINLVGVSGALKERRGGQSTGGQRVHGAGVLLQGGAPTDGRESAVLGGGKMSGHGGHAGLHAGGSHESVAGGPVAVVLHVTAGTHAGRSHAGHLRRIAEARVHHGGIVFRGVVHPLQRNCNENKIPLRQTKLPQSTLRFFNPHMTKKKAEKPKRETDFPTA